MKPAYRSLVNKKNLVKIKPYLKKKKRKRGKKTVVGLFLLYYGSVYSNDYANDN